MRRSDMNGRLLYDPKTREYYLVDDGTIRRIQDYMGMFAHVFLNFPKLKIEDYDNPSGGIDQGSPLPAISLLFRYENEDKVYFLDGPEGQQNKRLISNLDILNIYQFDRKKIHVIPGELILPDGPAILPPIF